MAKTSTLLRIINSAPSIRCILLENVYKQSLPSTCRLRQMATKATDQPNVDEMGDDAKAQNNQANADNKDDQLQAEIKKLADELKDHKEKYMRSIAESENMRKRLMKQTDDAKIFGIQSFCKDLLEVSDVLNTAVSSVPKEELTNSNPHLINLYEGLNMTESQLMKVFKKHGLESISPKEGDKFDPHVHEALFQVPVQVRETQQPDTVAIIQKIGFKLHERCLRPALVGVFKGS